MEKWKRIEGFEDYEVSDLGKVKRVVALERTWAGRILTSWPANAGVLKVTLHRTENGVRKRYAKSLHVLVAKAFIPNSNHLPEVNHKGPKTDCRASRLEWRSKKGNMLDLVQRNLRGSGVNLYRPYNMWRVRVADKHIGYYNTKREALAARRAAVKNLKEIL